MKFDMDSIGPLIDDCQYLGDSGGHHGQSGSEYARREVVDPVSDVPEGLLEGFLGAQAQRIGHGPVDITEPHQLLMGVIAHGHHQIPLPRHLLQPARKDVREVHAVAAGDLDGAWSNAVRRMRTRRHGWDFTDLLPERGGQLGPCAVSRADEQYAAGPVLGPGDQALQGAWSKPDVAAAPVSFRTVAGCQTGLVQRSQMMGQQIRRHPQLGLQLRRGEVPQRQQINDAQPRRISQGRMLGYPRPETIGCLNIH